MKRLEWDYDANDLAPIEERYVQPSLRVSQEAHDKAIMRAREISALQDRYNKGDVSVRGRTAHARLPALSPCRPVVSVGLRSTCTRTTSWVALLVWDRPRARRMAWRAQFRLEPMPAHSAGAHM